MERDERGHVHPFDHTGGLSASGRSTFHAAAIFCSGLVRVKRSQAGEQDHQDLTAPTRDRCMLGARVSGMIAPRLPYAWDYDLDKDLGRRLLSGALTIGRLDLGGPPPARVRAVPRDRTAHGLPKARERVVGMARAHPLGESEAGSLQPNFPRTIPSSSSDSTGRTGGSYNGARRPSAIGSSPISRRLPIGCSSLRNPTMPDGISSPPPAPAPSRGRAGPAPGRSRPRSAVARRRGRAAPSP